MPSVFRLIRCGKEEHLDSYLIFFCYWGKDLRRFLVFACAGLRSDSLIADKISIKSD